MKRYDRSRDASLDAQGDVIVADLPALRAALRTDGEPPAPTLCSFTLERHQRTLDRASARNLPIRYLGTRPVPARTELYPGREADWALMSLSGDPLFYSNGRRLVVPAAVKRDIDRALEAGIDFDALFIAHELPAGLVRPGQPIPLDLVAPPPPPEMQRYAERTGERSAKVCRMAGQVVLTVAATSLGLIRGAVKAASSAARETATGLGRAALAISSSNVYRDPILFGVNLTGERVGLGEPIGLWYYLTHWYWPSRR